MAALSFWATHFQECKAEYFVFPAEWYGAAGDTFCAKAYDIDPSKPIGSIKEAWEAERLQAATILKGETEETDFGKRYSPWLAAFTICGTRQSHGY
jgi:hypothetical protein